MAEIQKTPEEEQMMINGHSLSSYSFVIFDVSNSDPEPPRVELPEGEPARTGKKLWEVWVEGYAATEESGKAMRLTRKNEDTLWEGDTFSEACREAMRCLNYDMSDHLYNAERNTYWACRFYDNEVEARKSFG